MLVPYGRVRQLQIWSLRTLEFTSLETVYYFAAQDVDQPQILLFYFEFKSFTEDETSTLAFHKKMTLLEFEQVGNGLMNLSKLTIYYIILCSQLFFVRSNIIESIRQKNYADTMNIVFFSFSQYINKFFSKYIIDVVTICDSYIQWTIYMLELR